MKKLKVPTLILLICCCILQGHGGDGYRNEVKVTPAPLEESTTQKSGFFSGIKNFFHDSPTTTTTPRTLTQGSFNPQRPPPLTISQAPLMPLGPRPDTPLSSAFGGLPYQPPQWPQIHHSTSTSTTIRPQSTFMRNNHGNTNGQHNGSHLTPALTSIRQKKPQPSGFDQSYGGGKAGERPFPNENKPGFGLVPLSSFTSETSTTSTYMKPIQTQPTPTSQQPQMNIDLGFGSSSTTVRFPTQAKEVFPPLPPPRQTSIGGREKFKEISTTKSPTPTPASPTRPLSLTVWNTTPPPPRTAASTPSQPTQSSPSRLGSTTMATQKIGNRISFIPSAGSGGQNGGDKPLATDNEISELTENLYTKEMNSQMLLIQVNIQGKTRSIDSTDEAPNPLMVVDNRALDSSTIVKLRSLFNNYESDVLINEHVTPNERKEENEFLDAIMSTNVMHQAMLFLQNKGIVTPDPKTHRNLVKELWFTQYSRGSGKVGSSGFEHVFLKEVKNGTIIGLHNWVYFYEEEKAGRLDYKGYMKELDIGNKGKVLKARFTHNGLNKPVNTLFIGTSPELEIALYTVCFKLRPDRTCPVSLGNAKIGIITFSWRHRGKNLIGSAYPEI